MARHSTARQVLCIGSARSPRHVLCFMLLDDEQQQDGDGQLVELGTVIGLLHFGAVIGLLHLGTVIGLMHLGTVIGCCT